MTYRVLIIGGTGQVGSAVVRASLADSACVGVVMVNRRAAAVVDDARWQQVVLDTASDRFASDVADLARGLVAKGGTPYGVSCVGVGKGSAQWSEEALKALEIGVVGGFARGCLAGGIERFALLSAVGSSAESRIRYVRIMGMKEDTVRAVGFRRLAIFQPGIIAGNGHTPGWVAALGRLVPGRFGVIDQNDMAGAFVAEFGRGQGLEGLAFFENGAMRRSARATE